MSTIIIHDPLKWYGLRVQCIRKSHE